MNSRNRKMETKVKIGNLDTYSKKFPSPRIGESTYFPTYVGINRRSLVFDPLKSAKLS